MVSDDDDEVLLGRLRRLAADADPTPDTVLAAADAAIETRDLDGRLAALVADSSEPHRYDARTRVRDGGSMAQGRMLSYAAEGVHIDLAVQPETGSLVLIGQLTGASVAGCALERPSGTATTVEPDDMGRFLIGRLEPGPVRLRCRSVAGILVITEWLSL